MSKIVFGIRDKVTIKLPVSGGEVEMYKFLTVGETREVLAKYPMAADLNSLDAQDGNLEMLMKLIVSWNFTDVNGVDLPISIDILKQFASPDIAVLGEVIEKGMDKKKA